MKPVSAINRLFNRLQERFRRARAGSVLILVVALLVLMALLGTAFISTARTDRYSATVNTANTEVELLVQGVINTVVSTVIDDLYDPAPNPTFGGARDYRRPPVDGAALGTVYEHFDAVEVDTFIASRVPGPLNPGTAADDPATGTNPPTWRGVTWPLIARPDGTYWFDRPGARSVPLAGGKGNIAFSPTFIPTPSGPVPGLRIWIRGAGGAWTAAPAAFSPMRAADADGDGIADAGMWKIPVGTIEGITYYAAVRVVDNNSAINVNTALSRTADFGAPNAHTAINYSMFFPSRVGLAEMLRTFNPGMSALSSGTNAGAEMLRMNQFRFNNAAGLSNNVPVRDDGTAASPAFAFSSVGDALNSQLARRIKFPGRNTAALPYQAYGIGESMTLAYRGGLVNPNVSPSLLEQHLEDSLITNVPAPDQFAQTAAGVTDWYTRLYNFDLEVHGTPAPNMTFRPLRTLLVASNPVANQAPVHFANTDAGPTEQPPLQPLRNDLPPGMSGMKPYVDAAGEQANPPKTSLNTATFEELYRAFWNVMAEDADSTPVDATLALFDATAGNRDLRLDPYYGQRFDPLPPYASISAEQNPARMFRSVIRDTRSPVTPLTLNRTVPYQTMKLRAALAAVNAMDLRDSDDDVTEATVTVDVVLDNPTDAVQTPTQARVFGTEAQPYITEVYANLHRGPTASGVNLNGYVAIELTNPYPVAIPLRPAGSAGGWNVGLIDRRPLPGKTQLTVERLELGAAIPWHFPEGTQVPAAGPLGPGKLILENYDPTGGGAGTGAATYRPPLAVVPAGALTVYVPYLHRVFENPADATAGGELVLLRPRAGSGIAAAIDVDNDGTAEFDEVNNLYDLIPADSFDFTGMSMDTGSAAAPYLWMHYVRENGPGPEFAWRFVYPGRYDASATTATVQRNPGMVPPQANPRHQGVQTVMFGEAGGAAPTEEDILLEKPVALGAIDPVPAGAGYYTNPFTIQIANKDFGGHNKVGAPGSPTPMQYPFGGFARNGDVLQVPFIGPYVIDMPNVNDPPTQFLEMNSLSMDSVLAEDTDTANDPVLVGATPDESLREREQVGRFYPLARNVNTPLPVPVGQTDDFYDGVATGNAAGYNLPGEYWNFTQSADDAALSATYVPQWRYRWAMDLFDYVTVQAPHDDYLPNVSKLSNATAQPVSNSGGTAGDASDPSVPVQKAELREPVEGLININTASWKVLSALPLVVSNGAATTSQNFPAVTVPAGQVHPALSRELAKIIVYYRDVDADPFTPGNQPHGPFKSIMELNKVVDTRDPNAAVPNKGSSAVTVELNARPGFRNAMDTISFLAAGTDPNDEQGDFSPVGAATTEVDGVRSDFEEKSLALSRISNLVTTRSDSFTCYLLVQGYRDADSLNPELIVQRRVAFLLDRSGTVPAFPQPVVTKIPNN